MTRRNRLLLLIASCGLTLIPFLNSFGQDRAMNSAPAFSGGVFVTPVADAPFTAQVDQAMTQILADGSSFQRKTSAFIARDALGRIHNEAHQILPASSTQIPALLSIHVYDPATRLNTFLNPYTHIARQNVSANHPSTEPPANGWVHLKSPLSSIPNLQVQDLGTNMIEGLEVHGYRKTLTIPAKASGTDRPVVVFDEIWYNEDLHINLLTRQDDPRIGSLTMTVSNINVGDPDPELFAIPTDYKLVDMTPPEMEAREPGRVDQ